MTTCDWGNYLFMSINQTGIGKNESLPASVKGASEVQSTGARFVVSSRTETIHKTAVGERSLHKQQDSSNSDFVQQHLKNFHRESQGYI